MRGRCDRPSEAGKTALARYMFNFEGALDRRVHPDRGREPMVQCSFAAASCDARKQKAHTHMGKHCRLLELLEATRHPSRKLQDLTGICKGFLMGFEMKARHKVFPPKT